MDGVVRVQLQEKAFRDLVLDARGDGEPAGVAERVPALQVVPVSQLQRDVDRFVEVEFLQADGRAQGIPRHGPQCRAVTPEPDAGEGQSDGAESRCGVAGEPSEVPVGPIGGGVDEVVPRIDLPRIPQCRQCPVVVLLCAVGQHVETAGSVDCLPGVEREIAADRNVVRTEMASPAAAAVYLVAASPVRHGSPDIHLQQAPGEVPLHREHEQVCVAPSAGAVGFVDVIEGPHAEHAQSGRARELDVALGKSDSGHRVPHQVAVLQLQRKFAYRKADVSLTPVLRVQPREQLSEISLEEEGFEIVVPFGLVGGLRRGGCQYPAGETSRLVHGPEVSVNPLGACELQVGEHVEAVPELRRVATWAGSPVTVGREDGGPQRPVDPERRLPYRPRGDLDALVQFPGLVDASAQLDQSAGSLRQVVGREEGDRLVGEAEIGTVAGRCRPLGTGQCQDKDDCREPMGPCFFCLPTPLHRAAPGISNAPWPFGARLPLRL